MEISLRELSIVMNNLALVFGRGPFFHKKYLDQINTAGYICQHKNACEVIFHNSSAFHCPARVLYASGTRLAPTETEFRPRCFCSGIPRLLSERLRKMQRVHIFVMMSRKAELLLKKQLNRRKS